MTITITQAHHHQYQNSNVVNISTVHVCVCSVSKSIATIGPNDKCASRTLVHVVTVIEPFTITRKQTS